MVVCDSSEQEPRLKVQAVNKSYGDRCDNTRSLLMKIATARSMLRTRQQLTGRHDEAMQRQQFLGLCGVLQ